MNDKNNLPQVGQICVGTVVAVYSSYAILLFDEGWTGLLHISEVSSSYIRSFASYISIGSIYNVKVIAVDGETGAVRVSIKQMTNQERRRALPHRPIDPKDIDFSALERMLPRWIEEENEGGRQPAKGEKK